MITLVGWLRSLLINLTYIPINPFNFKIDSLESDDKIKAESFIWVSWLLIFSVTLYIRGIILINIKI